MKSKKLLLFAVAAAFAVATLPLAAQNPFQPWGTYAFTGSASCLDSPSGFTGLDPVTAATTYTESWNAQGTFTFKADGTGTEEGGSIVLDYFPAPYVGASGVTDSAPFTYTVAKDGTLTLVFGTRTGTFVAGEFAGILTYADTLNPNSTGRIALNGTVVLTSTPPAVETITFYYEGTEVGAVTRICTRTAVLVPLY